MKVKAMECRSQISTTAPPGSEEKIEVLRLRLEAGLPLHDDFDNTDVVIEEYKPIVRQQTTHRVSDPEILRRVEETPMSQPRDYVSRRF